MPKPAQSSRPFGQYVAAMVAWIIAHMPPGQARGDAIAAMQQAIDKPGVNDVVYTLHGTTAALVAQARLGGG